ncbi:MAG: prepilin-type N-terminal cleavage/methylation domain-containing protein [Patescibacteria group bacterium]|nr:prepilin-type N-terminal cleavage/methylation domain-containing protein [Patescibacteria group bacterium]
MLLANRDNCQNKKSGFTLIELLVVISIIAFLASATMIIVNIARIKSRDSRRTADLRQIYSALQLYYDANSLYPSVFSGPGSTYCSALTSASASWLAPHLSKLPADPLWQGSLPYSYQYCQKYSGAYDRQTYTLWAKMEGSSGNVDPAVWPVGPYRPSGYNYVIANWQP